MQPALEQSGTAAYQMRFKIAYRLIATGPIAICLRIVVGQHALGQNRLIVTAVHQGHLPSGGQMRLNPPQEVVSPLQRRRYAETNRPKPHRVHAAAYRPDTTIFAAGIEPLEDHN